MTTVVCNGKAMASDGMISAGDVIVETNRSKIHRLKDGRIVGFAGSAYNWGPLLDYFNSTLENKKWPTISAPNQILVLELDGRCVLYDVEGRTFERTAPTAIGSGWQIALGALEAGASLKKSVEIASKRDVSTGGEVFYLELA